MSEITAYKCIPPPTPVLIILHHICIHNDLQQNLSKMTAARLKDQLSLSADQKYSRMLQGEYSAILSTGIKLLFLIKIFVKSIFKWPLKTGFTVQILPVSHYQTQQSLLVLG